MTRDEFVKAYEVGDIKHIEGFICATVTKRKPNKAGIFEFYKIRFAQKGGRANDECTCQAFAREGDRTCKHLEGAKLLLLSRTQESPQRLNGVSAQ